MSMMSLAIWLQQDNDPSAATRHLIVIFFLVMAIGVAILAVIMMYVGLKALNVLKELGSTAAEMKTKFLPLLDEVMQISKTSRVMLEDAAPKIKALSANLVKASDTLVETSLIARSAVEKVEGTITDANLRTQRQVARVDGMVSAALTTTQEVADTIANGIRVPAMKIAEMMQQAKTMGEGLMAKVKGGSVGSAFGGRRRAE
jgi:ferritin-like metal-binding protein YciE